LHVSRTTKKTVYIEGYGCTSNKFDLEITICHLLNLGYKLVDNKESADILIINTCGVKKQTEDKMLSRIKNLSALNKPLIISGCLPRINLSAIKKASNSFSVVIDPNSIDRMPEALELVKKRKKNFLLSFSSNMVNNLGCDDFP